MEPRTRRIAAAIVLIVILIASWSARRGHVSETVDASPPAGAIYYTGPRIVPGKPGVMVTADGKVVPMSPEMKAKSLATASSSKAPD